MSNEVKWSKESKEDFEIMKKYIGEEPLLINLYYSKPFLIFSLDSTRTIVAVLLENNNNGYEKPIAFFRKALRDVELKYSLMEKQAYAMVKGLKFSGCYVLY